MTFTGDEERDPGLQPERTLLSWQRTLILVVVVGVLFLRGSLEIGGSVVPETPPLVRFAVVTALLFLSSVLGLHLWFRWRRVGRGLADPGTGKPPLTLARPWAMWILSVAVLVLSAILMLTVFLA